MGWEGPRAWGTRPWLSRRRGISGDLHREAVKETDERQLDALVAEAREDPDVLAVVRFGSTARGLSGRDVDVCVVLHEKPRGEPFDVHLRYSAHASGKRHEGLDVSVFQSLPLYVRERVIAEGVPLLVKDREAFFALVRRTYQEWETFRPHLDLYLDEVVHG